MSSFFMHGVKDRLKDSKLIRLGRLGLKVQRASGAVVDATIVEASGIPAPARADEGASPYIVTLVTTPWSL